MMKMVKKPQVVQDQNIHGDQKLAHCASFFLFPPVWTQEDGSLGCSGGASTSNFWHFNMLCNIYHMMYNRVWKKEDVV